MACPPLLGSIVALEADDGECRNGPMRGPGVSIWASPVVYVGDLMPLLAVAAPWEIPSPRRAAGRADGTRDHAMTGDRAAEATGG